MLKGLYTFMIPSTLFSKQNNIDSNTKRHFYDETITKQRIIDF